jgi:GrpE
MTPVKDRVMPENIRRRIALGSAAVVGVLSAAAIALSTGSWTAAAIAVVAAVLAGAVPLAITAAPVTAPAPVIAAGDGAAAQERARLVAASLYLRDRLTSKALTDRLDQELAAVGVVPVAPQGERFDPAVHTAEGAQPTAEPGLVGTIARVDAPGWADRGVLLRPASVTVYQPDSAVTQPIQNAGGQSS